jgi:hypothetical protein
MRGEIDRPADDAEHASDIKVRFIEHHACRGLPCSHEDFESIPIRLKGVALGAGAMLE